MNIESNESLSQLALADKYKYVTLEPIFGDKTLQIINGLNDRGRNSYSALQDKIEFFERGLTPELSAYYDALYSVFELDVETDTIQIVSKVSSVRRKLELPQYKSKLQLKCEADFCRLFVFKELPRDIDPGCKVIKEQPSRFIPYARVRPAELIE